MSALEYHPLANLFPLIEGQAFDDLVADVQANGLLDRIVIHEDMILDGRNRYRAAIAAGLLLERQDWRSTQNTFRVFDPFTEGDPLAWVLSKNLHRRHLDESQRSAVGAKLETLGPSGRIPEGTDANLHRSRAEIAEIVNVSPRTIASSKKVMNEGAPELFTAIEQGKVKASVAEKLLALPRDKQVEAVQLLEPRRLTTLAKQATRQLVEQRLADKQRALPAARFGVIYADPAWRFEPYARDTGLDRAADNHYPTQETGEILKLPVGTIAAPDCVLFLWATVPMLCDALRVLRFWGFEYKSQFVWDKVTAGTGYWNRNQHELLLVGTRGNIPAPAPGTQWPSIIRAPAGRHSEKPDDGYRLIEDYYPNLPKIELNARRRRDGWTAWGLEAPDVETSPSSTSHEGTAEQERTPGSDAGFEDSSAPLQRSSGAGAQLPDSLQAKPENSPPAGDPNQIIRDGYARNASIAELMALTGLSADAIKSRAKRMELGSRDRQRAAVAAANRRRGRA